MNWVSNVAQGFGPALLALTLFSACSATPLTPSSPSRPARPARPAFPALVHDLDAILDDPVLARGTWGVVVRSAKTGETLYERNPQKLLLPASNMKVVTLAAAAERLGWDYTYETRLYAGGTIQNGTLEGDLVVAGSGDPSVGGRDLDAWADQLKQTGIRTIAGAVVGDDRAFETETLGFGWSWDDLPDDYAAGVGALQFNESAVRVTIAPGPAAGSMAAVEASPPGGLTIDSEIVTGAAESTPSIAALRLPGRNTLTLRGSIPAGARPVTRDVSVDNPSRFFVQSLRRALIAHGIDVRGAAVEVGDIDEIQRPPAPTGRPLVTHRSAPLSALAVRLMKVSQNQYAETFLKTLGAAPGRPASASGGRAAVLSIVGRWGVESGELIQRDGSGLSRYDFVSARALAAILLHIHRDERLREPFVASLPVPGDGTLSNRLKGTAAEGKLAAKTGSMTGVRTLSGYVTTDDDTLAFAILANNFETGADVVNKATDAIVVRLVDTRR